MNLTSKIISGFISSSVVTSGSVFTTNKYLTLKRELIRELKHREETLINSEKTN